jgi:hypothetical protein
VTALTAVETPLNDDASEQIASLQDLYKPAICKVQICGLAEIAEEGFFGSAPPFFLRAEGFDLTKVTARPLDDIIGDATHHVYLQTSQYFG